MSDEYEYEEYSEYVSEDGDAEAGGVGRGKEEATETEGGSGSGDSEVSLTDVLPSSLAPATVRIIKLLKEAEEELNAGPSPEDIAWEEELESDYSAWGYVRWSGWKTFKGAEWLGGKIAHATGITAPKFQYYIDQAIREREEENRRRREAFEARTAVMEAVERGGAPQGGGGHSFVSSEDLDDDRSDVRFEPHSNLSGSSIAMSSHE